MQVIIGKTRPRNDLLCVERDVKHDIISKFKSILEVASHVELSDIALSVLYNIAPAGLYYLHIVFHSISAIMANVKIIMLFDILKHTEIFNMLNR